MNVHGEHGSTPLHYASRYRKNNSKTLIGAAYNSTRSGNFYRSRRRGKTLRNLVGARKKGSGLLGVGRGTKKRNDDQGRMKAKIKGSNANKRQLIHRLFRPLFSRPDVNIPSHDNVGMVSQSSTPNHESDIELCERKSLIDDEESGRRSNTSNAEAGKAVPHIKKERATPVEEDEKAYSDYEAFFVDGLTAVKREFDSSSLGRAEMEDGHIRGRGANILSSKDSFLDISLNCRPPVKSVSMPDIQAVETTKELCNDGHTGVDMNVAGETIADKEKVRLGRCETFTSPRGRLLPALKRLGECTLEGLMAEGRSLDTLWNIVDKEKKPHDTSIILYLLENNANINARDYYGATPLHYAAQRGNVIAVKELLSDPNIDIEVRSIMI